MDPKSREGVYFALFVVLIACVCIGFAANSYTKAKYILDHGITVPGTVTESWSTQERGSKGKKKTVYHVRVAYQLRQGERAETEAVLRRNVGDSVQVTYLPDNPSETKVDFVLHPYFDAKMLLGIGSLIGLIGIWMATHYHKKRQRTLWLIERGEKIKAKVTNIEHHFSRSRKRRGRSRNRTTYTIHAEWTHPTSGKYMRFVSHRLKWDPGDELRGREIGVYINSLNPSEYYVDVHSF